MTLPWPTYTREEWERLLAEPKTAGGHGSGNFGHAGRPGEVGGSSSDLTHPLAVMGDLPVRQQEFSDYLAKHGQKFEAAPLPASVERGKQNECYRNASLLTMTDPSLEYAEGLAYNADLPKDLGFLHAWAVTKDGKVVDNTWPHPEKNTYFGIIYPREKYLPYIIKNKVYGVFGGLTKNARNILKKGGL